MRITKTLATLPENRQNAKGRQVIGVIVGGLLGFALTVTYYNIKQRVDVNRSRRWIDSIPPDFTKMGQAPYDPFGNNCQTGPHDHGDPS